MFGDEQRVVAPGITVVPVQKIWIVEVGGQKIDGWGCSLSNPKFGI